MPISTAQDEWREKLAAEKSGREATAQQTAALSVFWGEVTVTLLRYGSGAATRYALAVGDAITDRVEMSDVREFTRLLAAITNERPEEVR